MLVFLFLLSASVPLTPVLRTEYKNGFSKLFDKLGLSVPIWRSNILSFDRTKMMNFGESKQVKEYEEYCKTVMGSTLNPCFFEEACSLRAKAQNSGKITDLEFLPYLQDQQRLMDAVKMLREYSADYHKGYPQITNLEYDLLKRKIICWIDTLHKRGCDVSHIVLPSNGTPNMLDVYSEDDLACFFSHIEKKLGKQDRGFLCSPAINGVPIRIKYKDGLIQGVFTSGLGEQEIDITKLVRTIGRVPELLSNKDIDAVFGVLFLRAQAFNRLNAVRKTLGKKCWSDTRSAIAQTLHEAEEPNKDLELELECYFDRMVFSDSKIQTSSLSKMRDMLKNLGFPVLPKEYIETARLKKDAGNDDHNALFYLTRLIKQKFPFESFGIKIQVDDMYERALTETHDCFLKFIPQLSTTKVKHVDFRVLQTGTVIAVIETDPVIINGKSVSNFSISNARQFLDLDIRTDSTLMISSLPNILPQIFKSYQTGKSEQISFPENCPRCNAALTKVSVEKDVALVCSAHLSCTDDNLEDFLHFGSLFGFNLPSLTPQIIQELKKQFLVYGTSDLFLLSIADHALLENVKLETFKKLLLEIKSAKNITMEHFIYALNIPLVTHRMAEQLSYEVGTITRLQSMSENELFAILQHKEVAKNIANFFLDSQKKKKIASLLNRDIIITEPDKEIMALCYDYPDTKEHYEQLVKKIQNCNKFYDVSDFEFDLLEQTAKKIEVLHPDWSLSRTPEQIPEKVVPFKDPIISNLKKTYSLQKLEDFCQKISMDKIMVEPKVNGVACSLKYEDGKLVSAFTKNGEDTGHEITDYVKTLPGIPQELLSKFTGMIRGELFITHKDFRKLNQERKKSGLDPYVDALGVVVGSLKKKEKNIPVHSVIQFFGYHVSDENSQNFQQLKSRIDLHNFLKTLGFKCDLETPFRTFNDLSSAIKYVDNPEARRRECEADIDGMILQSVNLSKETSYPLYAYKFKSEILTSRIVGVEFNLTSSGILSAVAEIKPTKFSNGRTVSRIYLSNPQTIYDLCENDLITLKYSGGITPVLDSIKKDKRGTDSVKIAIPKNCPRCSQKLSSVNSGALQCTNPKCTRQELETDIVQFATTMRLCRARELSPLLETGLVSKISDFYKLSSEELFENLEISNESVNALLENIAESKNVPFRKLLIALGIPVKYNVVARIAKRIDNLSELLRMTPEDLYGIGIMKKNAQMVFDYLTKNKSELKFLANTFNQSESETKKKKHVMITRDLPDMYQALLKKQKNTVNLISGVVSTLEKGYQENQENFDQLKTVVPSNKDERILYKKIRHIIHVSNKMYKSHLPHLRSFTRHLLTTFRLNREE